ncbi:MAG: rane protein [Paenibacillaceae bacterium]|nr:rane protein [Paenibacillaceae bacterium]
MGEQQASHDHDCPIEHFTNTEKIVRQDILMKAKELADLISTSTEVQFFQQAEKQIATNDTVQKLINQIKKKQKEAVAFETFKNPAMVKKIEAEIDQLQDELDEIPIVSEFKQSQQDINYMLQLIMTAIRDTVSEKINVEQGKVEQTSCGD